MSIHRGLTWLLAGVALTALPAAAQTSCDRGCLENYVAQYVAAMVKHDPSSLPLAADVTATQNDMPMTLGDGIWKTISGVLSQPQFVDDVAAQQVGYLGVISDAGKPAMFGLRLKIEDGKITQIESLLTHDGEGGPAFEPQGFIYREAPYISKLPKAASSSPAKLLEVANSYWRIATTTHDGSAVPYAVDCFHYENGMNASWERGIMANEMGSLNQPAYRPQAYDGRIWTCAREVYLTTSSWSKVHDLHFLVDPERGLVMNFAQVDTIARGAPGGGPGGPPGGGRGPGGGGAGGPPRAGGGMPAGAPIDGPGLAPLGMSMAGMRGIMGKSYTTQHFEVMKIVGGKIAREQDFMHILPLATQ